MSIQKMALTVGGGLLVVAVLLTGTAHATSIRSGQTVTVGPAEAVNGSLYIAGSNIKIEGTIKGDVFCAGQTVDIDAAVEGDILCAAQTLRIHGEVDGDVRAAAQSLDLGAQIAGSASLFGQSVNTRADSSIGRDLTIGGQSVVLDGPITRDVLGGAESIRFNSGVGRDVQVQATDVQLGAQTVIAGNLTYTSDAVAKVDNGSQVTGRTEHKHPQQSTQQSSGNMFAERLTSALYFFAAMLLAGLLLYWLAPKSYGAVRHQLVTHFWGSMAVGAVVALLTPFVVVLLLITGIGIPIALALLAVWAVGFMAAVVYGSYGLGRFVVKHVKEPSKWIISSSLVAGLALLAVVMLVPWLSAFVMSIITLWGYGAVVRSLVAHRAHTLSSKH